MFTDQDIHFVWIGPELSLLEQLTIKLYQRQNMNPILWAFDEIKNVPEGVLMFDANEILPKSTLFTYRNEGNGSSVSQWTDRFQLKLLQKYGGWYSQLDVACLRMPPVSNYYFVHYDATLVDVCFMRAPKDAPFLGACIRLLEQTINADSAMYFGWQDSMHIIGTGVAQFKLQNHCIARTFENGANTYMRSGMEPESKWDFIHWWNQRLTPTVKNDPMPGTFYYKLLKQVDLI
jgi:hypothetical protein